jgi:hypothetical protein
MVREDGTYYIVGSNLDLEKVRVFNAATLNLERAAEGKEMIPDILQTLGRENISNNFSSRFNSCASRIG